MIKAKAAFFSQSELFENFSDCSDWLDKSSKMPLLFWSCKQAINVHLNVHFNGLLSQNGVNIQKYYLLFNLIFQITFCNWTIKIILLIASLN